MKEFLNRINEKTSTPFALLTVFWVCLVGIAVLALVFGVSIAKAQLILAIVLGFSAVSSLALTMQARLDELERSRREAELDWRTVPTRESLNILATDVRELRETTFPDSSPNSGQ